MIRGEGGLVAINSEFGWVVTGLTNDAESKSKVSSLNLLIEERGSSTQLNRFWEIESMGIQESNEEESTDKEFLKNIQYLEDEERYEVNLPCKSRLDKDKPLLQEYDKIIKDLEKMGIIDPMIVQDKTSYFLPHHGVIREDKETTKLRVVFDGSAKSTKDDPSLNVCLERGPNLVPHLFDTVINFRGYPIGLVADIKKALHQAQIVPEDRKMLKFLWFDDITQDHPTLKEYEFRRLPFGLTPIPAILSAVTCHHLSKYKEIDPDTVSLLLDWLYGDDFAGGANSDNEVLRIYRKSQDLMSKGGFKLRKWHSNSPYIRTVIANDEGRTTSGVKDDVKQPTSELIQPKSNASSGETVVETPLPRPSSQNHSTPKQHCVKILGISWNEDSDERCYDLEELIYYAKSLPVTKRSVLKLSAKIFDPAGLFVPFTITMKMLFQTLCTSSINWDDDLSGKALSRWNSLVHDLRALSDIKVPRCYFSRRDYSSDPRIL